MEKCFLLSWKNIGNPQECKLGNSRFHLQENCFSVSEVEPSWTEQQQQLVNQLHVFPSLLVGFLDFLMSFQVILIIFFHLLRLFFVSFW